MTLHVDTLESLSNATEITPSSDAVGPLNGKMALYPGNVNELVLKMPLRFTQHQPNNPTSKGR
jgi:hypothetical protein